MGWKAAGVGWADDSSTGTLVELERDLAVARHARNVAMKTV
jgi:hypothetical protein